MIPVITSNDLIRLADAIAPISIIKTGN